MQKHLDAPGTPGWHARRARSFNAGDASAMLGCHPSGKTRTQLLQELHTGLEREFSDYVQERVIEPGHRVEALWRPIAEEILGEDLQVLAGSIEVDGLSRPLGASLDGITFMEDTNAECKSANDALRAALPHSGRDSHSRNDARNLPKGYRVQLEQQQLVTGAKRTLFSACQFNADGSVAEERHCWYVSDPQLRAEIVTGWMVFDADLAAYVPTDIREMPKADVTLALPALFIHAKGEITTSNMKEYGAALAERLAAVRAIALITDQDFSNAKESAKLLRENIQQAKLAKDAMLAQTVTVGEAARMIDAWCEDMRLTALKLEQDVEREDKAKKVAMIAKAKGDYETHIEALKADTGGPWILLTTPNFAEAIKGKRNFASMQDAVDTMLANAKIAADESARKIRAALAALAEESKGYEHLFADRLAFISKPVEDVRSLARARITEHQAVEQRRAAELAERERARIRAEEEAKAQAKARAEQEAREAEERRQRAAAEAEVHARARAEKEAQQAEWAREQAAFAEALRREVPPVPLTPQTAGTAVVPPAAGPAVIPMPTRAPVAAPAAPTLRLGDIKKHIAPLDITAEGLRQIGFEPAGRQGSAVMYRDDELPYILTAAIQHLTKAREQLTAKAAA